MAALQKSANIYLSRYATRLHPLAVAADPATRQIVVIPCHRETSLLQALQSLHSCQLPACRTEVIIVINHSAEAPANIKRLNRATFNEAREWAASHTSPLLAFYPVLAELPPKHAGVGLARKAGMDEALHRFAQAGHNGAIICLDADCTVSPGYLQSFATRFAEQQEAGLAVVPFQHHFQQLTDDRLRQGIVHYELFLRYYVQGLRLAGFPFALHTVGSCMAVKAQQYALHGGMNRRKAAEDFYFIHKIAPHTPCRQIAGGQVYPSARLSDRVPFGTGKAQQDWLQGQPRIMQVYPVQAFEAVGEMLHAVSRLYQQGVTAAGGLSAPVAAWLHSTGAAHEIERMVKGSGSQQSFARHFREWFNGFRVLKMIHFLRDHFLGTMPLPVAARELLLKLEQKPPQTEAEQLLHIFRTLDGHYPV